jgi:exodeoxyribonuclease V alpha subunit
MQIRNNYDILWSNPLTGEADMGIFNGDIGVITAVDEGDAVLTVDFEGRIAQYSADLLGELELAYAVTIHKAQGSEYRAVVLAVSDVPPTLLTRGVLYTAITRARELLILVGDDKAVEAMVHNNKQARRYSGLRARLASGEW